MENLETSMTAVRDSADPPLLPIIRLAAHASLLAIGKYYALLNDCEVYKIAISKIISDFIRKYTDPYPVMCPDKKLEYFRKRGWAESDIDTTKALAIHRFQESYHHNSSTNTENTVSVTIPARKVCT